MGNAKYRSQPGRVAYDAIADWYAEWIDRESWAHSTILGHLRSLTGAAAGARILDIGCGEGYFCRALVQAGATVVGVDISGAMLRASRRVVVPDGWLAVGITHPCFDAPHASWIEQERDLARVVPTCRTEGRWASDDAAGNRGQVGAWHRTLGTWLNTARDGCWELETILEPASLTHDGQLDRLGSDIPRLLLARFRVRTVEHLRREQESR